LTVLALGFRFPTIVRRVFGPRSTQGNIASELQKANQQAGTNSIRLLPGLEKPVPRQASPTNPDEAHRGTELNEYWRRSVERGDCEGALQVAQAITAISPNKSSGWLKQGFALNELGRTEDAFQVLSSIIEMFPNESLPAYNLACYACKTGRLDEAKRWLRKSMEVVGVDRVRANALKDSDLEPLWQEIKSW